MTVNAFIAIFPFAIISLIGGFSDISDKLDLQAPLHELFIVKFEELAFNWSLNRKLFRYRFLNVCFCILFRSSFMVLKLS